MAKRQSKEKKLTARHDRFCIEYMVDLNGAQAAIRSGYSAKTARITASKLLTNPNILKKIESLKEKKSDEVNHSINDSIKLDFKIIEGYLELIKDIKADPQKMSSNKQELLAKLFNGSAFSSAQDRLAKKLGFYAEDNNQTKSVVNISPIDWIKPKKDD